MIKYLTTLIIFSCSRLLFASLPNSLENLLARTGFENVAVAEFNNDLIIAYENRIYRFEMDAMTAVMEIAESKILSSHKEMKSLEESIKNLKDKLEKEESRIKGREEDSTRTIDDNNIDGKLQYLEYKVYENIILLPLNRETPIVAVTIPFKKWIEFSNGQISGEIFAEIIDISFNTDEIWWIVEGQQKSNNRNLKLDLVVYPIVKSELDEYNDPYKIQFSLAPSLETSLGRGSLIRLQYLIPVIYRDFSVGLPEDKFRPGLMNLNHTVRLPQSFFMSASFGFFTDMRYGIDLELRKYLLNGLMSLGINSGLTGESRFYGGSYDFTVFDALTYFIDAEFRIPAYNLSLTARYGKYINEDTGFRFDAERQFGEFDIGLFVEKSSSDEIGGSLTTGGFYFAVPLWPSDYSEPGSIRVRPSEQFSWEYNATHFIYFHQKTYLTGNEIDHFLKRLQPDNIKSYFKKLETNINK